VGGAALRGAVLCGGQYFFFICDFVISSKFEGFDRGTTSVLSSAYDPYTCFNRPVAVAIAACAKTIIGAYFQIVIIYNSTYFFFRK